MGAALLSLPRATVSGVDLSLVDALFTSTSAVCVTGLIVRDTATEFTRFGQTSRFYRRDGEYYVHTRGVDGKFAEFQITHTFGWEPLQQYLVPFPGGRLQTLPIAWDTRQNRWYHFYPSDPPAPDDWLSARLAELTAKLRKAWYAERIPCWTDYLHETADRD